MTHSAERDRLIVIEPASETTPLLAECEPTDPSGVVRDGDVDDEEEESIPLPRAQIFLLCYTRVVEPVAFW